MLFAYNVVSAMTHSGDKNFASNTIAPNMHLSQEDDADVRVFSTFPSHLFKT